MELADAIKIVKNVIIEILEDEIALADDTRLIGDDSCLDSMKLVELCLELEDIADDHGFEFDWTSEAAMSKSRSMFRSVSALAGEFVRQSGEQS